MKKLLGLTTLLLGVVAASAQTDTPPASTSTIVSVTISARFIAQSTNTTVARDVTTTPAPRTRFISNADILRRIADDEGTVFPRNARLAVINGAFAVVQGSTVIADASSIMHLEFGTNTIMSGRQNNTNGLASPTITTVQIGRLVFDDTSINATNGLVFYLQGILTTTTSDTAVNARTGMFTETITANLPNAAGEGTNAFGSGNDQAIIVTGSLTGSGSGRQTLTSF